MQDILLSLLAWIGTHTSYNIPLQLPNLSLNEPYNICANYGINNKGQCEAAQLKAFYNKKNTIYLPLDFDIKTREDQARLVHELVHYVQWANHEQKKKCLGQLEVEAYELQDKWRISHSLSSKIDPFKMIMLAASCDD